MLPYRHRSHSVLALNGPVHPPSPGGGSEHRIDHLGHAGMNTFSLERGHGFAGDPTRHDMAEHAQSRVDVESEAVHGPLSTVTGPDGADLAGAGAFGLHPDAGEPVDAPRALQAQAGEGIDDELFDLVNIRRRGGRPATAPGRYA